jgi:hypothetical protein
VVVEGAPPFARHWLSPVVAAGQRALGEGVVRPSVRGLARWWLRSGQGRLWTGGCPRSVRFSPSVVVLVRSRAGLDRRAGSADCQTGGWSTTPRHIGCRGALVWWRRWLWRHTITGCVAGSRGSSHEHHWSRESRPPVAAAHKPRQSGASSARTGPVCVQLGRSDTPTHRLGLPASRPVRNALHCVFFVSGEPRTARHSRQRRLPPPSSQVALDLDLDLDLTHARLTECCLRHIRAGKPRHQKRR